MEGYDVVIVSPLSHFLSLGDTSSDLTRPQSTRPDRFLLRPPLLPPSIRPRSSRRYPLHPGAMAVCSIQRFFRRRNYRADDQRMGGGEVWTEAGLSGGDGRYGRSYLHHVLR